MKRTLTIIMVLAVVIALFSCTAETDYLNYVSELRKDIFVGKTDNFGVVAYSCIKESPYADDGVKNQTYPTLCIKVTDEKNVDAPLYVSFDLDGNKYEQQLTFSPVSNVQGCDIQVAALPEKNFDVVIRYGEEQTVVTLNSMLLETTCGYSEALKIATDKAKDFINENTENGILKAEIYLRLIVENDCNYYYVGFINGSGLKRAYLIDGKTGTILAEKQL